jgi:hypothetical protein
VQAYDPDPRNWAPEVDLIDDSDPPNASNFNTAPQGALDRTQWLYQRFAHAGQNWGPAFLPEEILDNTHVINFGGCAWSDASGKWLIGMTDESTNDAYMFSTLGADAGYGEAYEQVGSGIIVSGSGAGVVVAALETDPAPGGAGRWAGVEVPGVPNVLVCFASNANTAWSTMRTLSGFTSIIMRTFNGYLVYFAWIDDEIPEGSLSSTSNQGTSWSDTTITLDLEGSPYLAAAPDVGILAAFGTHVWFSSDGVTWSSAVSIPSGAGTQIAGCAWDPVRSLFVLAINNNSSPGQPMQWWTSPDGETWTNVSVTPDATAADFAIVNGVYVCTRADEVTNGGVSYGMYSLDGGQTWYGSQGLFFFGNITGTSQYYTRARISASPTGLCALNSLYARFSMLSGLPDEALP